MRVKRARTGERDDGIRDKVEDKGDVKHEEEDAHDGTMMHDEYEEDSISPPEPSIPQAPSKEEWIQHQITHIPFKNWCPICVRNAAMNKPHKRINHSRSCAHFSMDYM